MISSSSSSNTCLFTSKYGNISLNICPPTGAATPPPWCPPSPVGLYKVTKTTTCGLSIGATPQKDVTYLFVLTPSSEVPVFPPILYSSTFAFLPVPSDTTLSIILNTFSEVSLEITVSPFCTGISVTSFVSLSMICFTTLGFILVPPFAILDTAVANCIGVISNLWPKLIVANSTGPAFSLAKNILPASPGKSIPVVCNNLNFSKYS